jgi:hypothetical protein
MRLYFATPIDRNVNQHGHLDFSRLLANALRHLLADANAVVTQAPPSVQLALNEVRGQPGQYLLQAINLTPAARWPLAALVPAHGVEVQLRLPAANRLKSCITVRTEGPAVEVSHDQDAATGGVTVRVKFPELREYTALHLEVE